MPRNSKSGWTARSIATSIERSVQDGRIREGEALPPVRELARKLKISPATAAAAYRLLKGRGLTAARGRRGTRIVRAAALPASRSVMTFPENAVDLASGNPDPALLPPLDTALRAIEADPILYDRSPHFAPLTGFVAADFDADGIPSKSLTTVNGALDGLDRVLREHLRPGDNVAVEDPCFPAVQGLLVASGFTAVPFDVDDDGPVPASVDAALRKQCRAIIVTLRAQNPTGAALTKQRADELRAVVKRYPDVLLVESDPCGPVSGAPLLSLVDNTRARWAHIRSTSKFLGPDLRVAFVAGDALTINRVQARFAAGPRRVSYLLQQLVFALWSHPSAGRQLARASEVYRYRRNALLAALASRGVSARGVSGLNVWVPATQETVVANALASRGWAVAVGEPFRIRTAPGIRITVSTLDATQADQLAADVESVAGGGHHPSA